MKVFAANRIIKALVVFTLLIACRQSFAQSVGCLTADEARKAVSLTNAAPTIGENKALRLELLNRQTARQKIDQKIIDDPAKNQNLIPLAYETGEKDLRRVCEIVRQYGWVRKEAVGEDGAAAALFLIKNNKAVNLQREIFPVVAAAAKKGEVGNGQIAALIDIIRAGSGLSQIFGTQTSIRDGIFYLYPLQNDAKVDERRKLYDLPPLADFIKYLQSKYQTVVLKSPAPVAPPSKEKPRAASPAETGAVAADPLADLEKEETVRVESSLVNLNVRIESVGPATAVAPLQKNDFVVYEDGKPQEISFFSATDAPFDLILLLDLSGSTADKQDLIRKSTRRFIEAARSVDRIAIVTFTDEAKIVHDLTSNRADLLKSIKKIDDRGGSAVWGSLRFVYEKIVEPHSGNRRTAILLMTDGVDSSLIQGLPPLPSYPTFTDLLETVRSNDTTIIPIYLDTAAQANSSDRKAYQTARKTLEMLADETGGQVHYAKKVNDLTGVYEKIINSLSSVYSLAYEPPGDAPRGSFRRLSVKLPNHANLSARHKQGYYAK